MTSDTFDAPKMRTLADELFRILPRRQKSYSRLGAVGLVEVLFHWTRHYAPQGNVGKWTNQEIADGLDWRYSADNLIQAFIDSGWLLRHPELRLVVCDWSKHKEWDR